MNNLDVHFRVFEGIRKTINRFREKPFHFFTESDIHASLSKDIMEGSSDILTTRNNPFNTSISCVHHEYPTNFRYEKEKLLKGYKSWPENGQCSKTDIESKIGDRGNYDLAILNKEFIEAAIKYFEFEEGMSHIINKSIKDSIDRRNELEYNVTNAKNDCDMYSSELIFAIEVKFLHYANAANKNMLYEVIKDNEKLWLAKKHSNNFTLPINLVFCASDSLSRRDDNEQAVVEQIKEYIKEGEVEDYDKNIYFRPPGVLNVFIESYVDNSGKNKGKITDKPIFGFHASSGTSIKASWVNHFIETISPK